MKTLGCRSRTRFAGTHAVSILSLLLVATFAAGCNNKPRQRQTADLAKGPPATQATSPEDTPPPPPPTVVVGPGSTDTAPAETQAAQPVPETMPASSYLSEPPYTVRLYLRSPEEEQPGWLKVLDLANQDSPATCTGEFPERNRIQVQTDNVRRLRLHIAHLPLAADRRTFLRIDNQGIELARRDRRYIFFERLTTGEWVVAGSE